MPFSKINKNIDPIIDQIPLQVRITINKDFGKKAFLSVPAAMTLEAAMVLVLFLFASVCLILPMKILNTERRIQAGLESVGEDFSRYAYILDVLERGDASLIPGTDGFVLEFCRNLSAGTAEGYAMSKALEYADTNNVVWATMERSRIMEDGEVFDLILDYKVQLPFPVLCLSAVERSARCSRRAWIGLAGKKDEDDFLSDRDQEEMVYIGKNSSRYHKSSSCHYLSNDLSAVSYDAVGDLRNSGGGKYHPCSVCGKGAASGSVVYIMPSGSSFHTSKSCTAIIAYVQMVPLSEVSHLGPCSYCSGG
ncbi:MAG: hypothetical protein ACRDBO_10970 [Lachnospiraceae bacterium]